MLDGELFLPQDWSDDRDRCREAGIPDGMVHRTKWRIALELLDRATANGVKMPWLTFDEGYGQASQFLHELDDRGQSYVAEVPPTFTGWCARPKVLHKEHHPTDRSSRPRTFLRLAASARPASSVQNLFSCSSAFTRRPWQTFHIKDTAKGPSVWRAKVAPLHLKRDELPTTRPHWLVVVRNVLDPDEVKYFVSNAPAGTPTEVILHVAFQHWPVERCLQDQKTELGLDQFEVRNYTSLVRDLMITAVSFLFLSKVRHGRREKNLDLTVCQVRTAADELIRSRQMTGRRRSEYLQRPAGLIDYAQARNRTAAECHRKATLARLDDLGIDMLKLRCCRIE